MSRNIANFIMLDNMMKDKPLEFQQKVYSRIKRLQQLLRYEDVSFEIMTLCVVLQEDSEAANV